MLSCWLVFSLVDIEYNKLVLKFYRTFMTLLLNKVGLTCRNDMETSFHTCIVHFLSYFSLHSVFKWTLNTRMTRSNGSWCTSEVFTLNCVSCDKLILSQWPSLNLSCALFPDRVLIDCYQRGARSSAASSRSLEPQLSWTLTYWNSISWRYTRLCCFIPHSHFFTGS